MVFTLIEEKEIQKIKQDNKLEFETLRHTNAMKELNIQLEIAKESK